MGHWIISPISLLCYDYIDYIKLGSDAKLPTLVTPLEQFFEVNEYYSNDG